MRNNQETGVRVLLKHGAKKNKGNWGDCIPMTPLEYAQENKLNEIIELLISKEKPTFQRKTNPELPALTADDQKVNEQGKLSDNTGLIFQVPENED